MYKLAENQKSTSQKSIQIIQFKVSNPMGQGYDGSEKGEVPERRMGC